MFFSAREYLSPLGCRRNVRSRTCISTGIGSVCSGHCCSLWPPVRTPACPEVAGCCSTGPGFSPGTFGYAAPAASRWRTWSRRQRTRWSWRLVAHRATPVEKVKTKRLGRHTEYENSEFAYLVQTEPHHVEPVWQWPAPPLDRFMYWISVFIDLFISWGILKAGYFLLLDDWDSLAPRPSLWGGVFSFSFILTV